MKRHNITLFEETENKIEELDGVHIVNKFINKLNADGYCISQNNFNIICFSDIGKDIGHFWLEDAHKYNIRINIRLLSLNKQNYLITAIMHELAHAIQYEESFNGNIIKYNKDTNSICAITNDKNLALNTIFSNDGHTQLWLDIAKELNKKYAINPPIKAFLTSKELDLFLEEIFMEPVLSKHNMHVDTDISGLTIDDMMKYNVKPEYRISSSDQLIESSSSYTPAHVYRDLSRYAEDK